MSDLLSYKTWSIFEEIEPTEVSTDIHTNDALRQYRTGINNDVTLASEDENGIYKVYIDRLEIRAKRHKELYESYINGEIQTEDFIKDMEVTKRIMEDFMAYMDRFQKLATNKNNKNK